MATISRSALVMYSAEQMFDLVNDVQAYPLFLPNCAAAEIREQTDDEMVAALQIKKGGLSKWFATKNQFVGKEKVMMTLVDGPFENLSGAWEFIHLDEQACKVVLNLEYSFNNGLVEMAFGGVFKEVANNMVSAFTSRAKSVYGIPSL